MIDRDIGIIPRRDDISDVDRDTTYIIVDVFSFSSSVVQLLANGATHVYPAESEAGARDYTTDHPDAVVGGEPGAVTPSDECDIINSPTQIATVAVADRPASLYSTNGAQAVNRVAAGSDVFVGSTVNAQAVAATVRKTTSGPIRIIAAGNDGDVELEDMVGAMLLKHHLVHQTASSTERGVYAAALQQAYQDRWTDQRKHDDAFWTLQLDEFEVVPRLTAAGRLVDATSE